MRGITIITTGLFLFTGCFAFVNEAKAAPAGPHLLESKEPVCDTVLDEYRKLYFSDHNGAAISSLQYEGEEVQTSDFFSNKNEMVAMVAHRGI